MRDGKSGTLGCSGGRSFHSSILLDNAAFASSCRSCDILTDARVCRHSGDSGATMSASVTRASHLLSAFSSQLNKVSMLIHQMLLANTYERSVI